MKRWLALGAMGLLLAISCLQVSLPTQSRSSAPVPSPADGPTDATEFGRQGEPARLQAGIPTATSTLLPVDSLQTDWDLTPLPDQSLRPPRPTLTRNPCGTSQQPRPLSPTTPTHGLSFALQDTREDAWDVDALAWSHDGTMLAFFDGHGVYVVPAGQWGTAPLLSYGPPDYDSFFYRTSALAWSPDDKRLAFTQNRIEQGTWEPGIVVIDMHRNWSYVDPTYAEFRDWSLQNRIVARRGRELWVLDLATKQWTPVRDAAGNIATQDLAHWTPDGRLLVTQLVGFTPGGDHARQAVCLVDWQKNRWEQLPIEIVSLHGGADYETHVLMSPDERWIAWIERHQGATEYIGDDISRIMLYDRHTRTITEAANSRDAGTRFWNHLAWAPDSKRLAFSAYHGEPSIETLWILTIEGGN